MTKARTVGAKRRGRKRQDGPREPLPVEHPQLGPTVEARQHGHYVQGDSGRWAVYTNAHANVLGKLKAHKGITPRQCAAGLCFEQTWVRVWGVASPSRDSTIPPIGGMAHETEAQASKIARARARLNTILGRVGPARYSLLVSVCVFGEGIGSNRGAGKGKALMLRSMLRESLDQCALVYGITGEEEAA